MKRREGEQVPGDDQQTEGEAAVEREERVRSGTGHELPPSLRRLQIVREREVRLITGLSRTRRHELMRVGKFPVKVQISERASGWRLREIEEWLDSRPTVDDDLNGSCAAKRVKP